jgi:hypothetical protein
LLVTAIAAQHGEPSGAKQRLLPGMTGNFPVSAQPVVMRRNKAPAMSWKSDPADGID